MAISSASAAAARSLGECGHHTAQTVLYSGAQRTVSVDKICNSSQVAHRLAARLLPREPAGVHAGEAGKHVHAG